MKINGRLFLGAAISLSFLVAFPVLAAEICVDEGNIKVEGTIPAWEFEEDYALGWSTDEGTCEAGFGSDICLSDNEINYCWGSVTEQLWIATYEPPTCTCVSVPANRNLYLRSNSVEGCIFVADADLLSECESEIIAGMDPEALGDGFWDLLNDFAGSYGTIILLIIGFALGVFGVKIGFSLLKAYVGGRNKARG